MDCDPSKPSATYTGYEVEAFRAVVTNIGWLEVPSPQIQVNGTSFYFKCTALHVPDIINALIANVSEKYIGNITSCDIAAGTMAVGARLVLRG